MCNGDGGRPSRENLLNYVLSIKYIIIKGVVSLKYLLACYKFPPLSLPSPSKPDQPLSERWEKMRCYCMRATSSQSSCRERKKTLLPMKTSPYNWSWEELDVDCGEGRDTKIWNKVGGVFNTHTFTKSVFKCVKLWFLIFFCCQLLVDKISKTIKFKYYCPSLDIMLISWQCIDK